MDDLASADTSPLSPDHEDARSGYGRAPDRRAFGEFYLQNVDRVVGWLAGLGASRADAMDAAQEAFITLWARWPDVSNPVAYAMTVARHRWAATARRRQREEAWSPELDDRPAETLESLTRMSVMSSLSNLPMRQREIVVLHAMGFRLEEIADLLGITRSTAGVHLHRARKQLARAIGERTEE